LTAPHAAGAGLLAALDDLFRRVAVTPARGQAGSAAAGLTVYDAWAREARAALGSAPRGEASIRLALAEQLDRLAEQMRSLDPELDGRVAAAASAYARYFDATRQGFQLGNLPMLTLEGTYLQPPFQPRLLQAKLVYAWSPKGRGTVNPGTLTWNAGVSFYT